MPAKSVAVLAAVALMLAACSSSPLSSQREAPRVGRVVVAPLNLALRTPPELEDVTEPVEHAILGYFQGRDRRVTRLAASDADILWYQVTSELERSGSPVDLSTASAAFARRLAEHTDYELLVMPSLLVRAARVLGRHASWDGVRRRLEISHLEDGSTLVGWSSGGAIEFVGYTGNIAAASLHVAVLTAAGEPVHQGLGGLALIQALRHDDARPHDAWALGPREQPFDDPDALREGVRVAFERGLPERRWAR